MKSVLSRLNIFSRTTSICAGVIAYLYIAQSSRL